jgi:hypothetical protein
MSLLVGPKAANAAALDRAATGHVKELLASQAELRASLKTVTTNVDRNALRKEYWSEHSIRIDRSTHTAWLATWQSKTGELIFRRYNASSADLGPYQARQSTRIVMNASGHGRVTQLDRFTQTDNQRLDRMDTTTFSGGAQRAATHTLTSQFRNVNSGRWMAGQTERITGTPRAPHVDVPDHVPTYGTHTPTRIVLHSTESGDAKGTSDIKGIFNFWRSQNQGLGTHLIVDGDGYSGKGARFTNITAGVLGANPSSIHIEQVGFAKWTRAQWMRRQGQLHEVAQWLAKLSDQFDIPLVHPTGNDPHRGVTGHYQYTTSTHTDPGNGYPWDYVMKLARWYKQLGV